jgi:uncharacterized protein
MRHPAPPDRFDILLKLGGFLIVAVVLWVLILGLVPTNDGVLRSVTASLLAGLIANFLSSRWFGSGSARDFGLAWSVSAAKQTALGWLLGFGALAAILGGAWISGTASWSPDERGNLAVLTIALLAGAAGEELLFRGYAFQFLAESWPVQTIVGSGALFGLTHVLLNENIQWLGAINTALWGALLGFAYWRTRALWLPIGIHFGWNLAQVLAGVSLSGTTIRATGVRLEWTASDLWSGGAYGPEGGLWTTIAGGALLLILRRVR